MSTEKEPRHREPGENQENDAQRLAESPKGSRLHRAALKYAEMGLPVFPLRPRGKEPLIPKRKGGNGCRNATTDRGQITDWWTRWPNANIGIATGPLSGIWILDVDVRPEKNINGEFPLSLLLEEHGDFPETPTQHTGGGGRQIVFRCPVDERAVKNDAGKKIAPGLDVRGDGGYFVAPPSIHPSGKGYTWADGLKPSDLEPADAPEWLLGVVASDSETGSTWEKRPPEHWEGLATRRPVRGTRNTSLTSVVGKLFHIYRVYGGLEREMVICLSVLYGLYWCDPPLPIDEILKVIFSVFGREAERESV